MLANLVIVLVLSMVLVATPSLVYAQLTMDNLKPKSSTGQRIDGPSIAQGIKDIIGWTEINFTIDNEDERLFGDNLLEWEVSNFEADIQKMCESDSCTFTLDDAEFRENSASYAYVLEGILKVGTELPDGSTETDNYELWGSMDRIKTIERADGTILENVVGDIDIDRTQATFNLDPEYEILVSGNVTRDLDDGTGTVAILGLTP